MSEAKRELKASELGNILRNLIQRVEALEAQNAALVERLDRISLNMSAKPY